MKRRRWLQGAAALALPGAVRGAAPLGWTRPALPVPDLELTGHGGQRLRLKRLLSGQVTAVQLMFTGCSTTCPPQGAQFAALAARLPAGVQLLSLSVDALGDDARALAAWLQRFGSPRGWSAAVPAPAQADAMARFFKGTDRGADTHTSQVFVVDRDARLVYRTGDLPAPDWTAALLAHVVAGGAAL